MFNRSTIITEGSDLVGWRQSATGTTLSDHLTTSQSGLYVNDLRGVDFDIIEDGLSDNYSTVNDYLNVVHESEIVSLVYDFVSRAKEKLASRELLNNFDVTNGVADFTNLATKNSRFVGWLIKPHKSNNIKIALTKIGLQLDTAETVRIYLYETSQQTAIATYDFVYSAPLSVQWKTVTDFLMNYRGEYGTNQQYILGYYETSTTSRTNPLTGQAVKFDFDCGCDNAPQREFGRYVEIQPIVIPNANLNGVTLPDTQDLTSYYVDTSYGIFGKINVTCDITDVIVDNMDIFAKALQYRIAVRVLDDYLASKRVNTTTSAKHNIDFAEYARNMYSNLLIGWTDNADKYHRGLLEDITIDFSGMDNICLPCQTDLPKTAYINYR